MLKAALSALALVSLVPWVALAEDKLTASQQTAVDDVDARREELVGVNKAIWNFAELGLQEHKSSALLIEKIKAAGFKVRTGVANMPTAFVAEYGEGKPIIGILAEYDALPGMSQKSSPQREPVTADAPGHACGHSGLGTAALGSAIAVRTALEKHKLHGTIRLYGTPAEETLIGKVYMLLAGEFDDLDVCLHWHPSDRNESAAISSKAAVSAKFQFTGTAAHASGSPERGRSALDAVELMNIGANFMREHIKEDARVHYVITNGGGAPNVVPAKTEVWYYVRASNHGDVEKNFAWLNDIARGAALMTQTTFTVQVDTDCHEIIPNEPLAELLYQSMQKIGAPKFTDEEQTFARKLQAPLSSAFGTVYELAIDDEIHRTPRAPGGDKGSTDVGDISWRVPTGGLKTACFPAESPGHSWQNVASIGSTIGEKGTIFAAKVLACTALDLFEQPKDILAAKADWQLRMKDRKYTSVIPAGQKAPAAIR